MNVSLDLIFDEPFSSFWLLLGPAVNVVVVRTSFFSLRYFQFFLVVTRQHTM